MKLIASWISGPPDIHLTLVVLCTVDFPCSLFFPPHFFSPPEPPPWTSFHYPSLQVWANLPQILETFCNFRCIKCACACVYQHALTYEKSVKVTGRREPTESSTALTWWQMKIKRLLLKWEEYVVRQAFMSLCKMETAQWRERRVWLWCGRAHKPRADLWELDGGSYFWLNKYEICCMSCQSRTYVKALASGAVDVVFTKEWTCIILLFLIQKTKKIYWFGI